MIKTPITVLQEMMIKLGLVPKYECVSQMTYLKHKVCDTTEINCDSEPSLASSVISDKIKSRSLKNQLLRWDTLGINMNHIKVGRYLTDVEKEEFVKGKFFKSGPQHQAMFEYRCTVNGSAASGLARSKKEAKQEAARRMLQKLYARGIDVPPPYATQPDSQPRPPSPPSPTNNPALEPGPSSAGGSAPALTLDTRSYVALLKELCEEYRLGEAEYELVGDTGPAHQRHFTVRTSLGLHSRQCTSTTKKAARQQAAEQLYKYLRDNLSRLTGDFVEEEALARAVEKSLLKKKEAAAGGGAAKDGLDAAIERYTELREAGGRCLDLGQRISEYHLGLMIHIDKHKRKSGLEALAAARQDADPQQSLLAACGALGLRVESIASCGAAVSVLRLVPTSPPLSFAGGDPEGAARVALRYLRRGLLHEPDAALLA